MPMPYNACFMLKLAQGLQRTLPAWLHRLQPCNVTEALHTGSISCICSQLSLTALPPHPHQVRLKRFLEMRGADGGPWRLICGLPALWVGLLYDEQAQVWRADACADHAPALPEAWQHRLRLACCMFCFPCLAGRQPACCVQLTAGGTGADQRMAAAPLIGNASNPPVPAVCCLRC